MAAHTNGRQVGFCSTHQDSAYCHVRSYTAIDQTRCDCTLWETGSRSCEALRGPFLAAMTVLESGLSNQNSIDLSELERHVSCEFIESLKRFLQWESEAIKLLRPDFTCIPDTNPR
jgi:hypothetical protein